MRGRRRIARKIAQRLWRCPADKAPYRIGTLQRAVGVLRSSWRAAAPLTKTGRSCGHDLRRKGRGRGPDFFPANRLATLLWRARWARQPLGFRGPPPPTKWGMSASTRGTRRKLS